jgi:hypothetical protein
VLPEGLGILKKFIHLIGSRTRDLPACSYRVPLTLNRMNVFFNIVVQPAYVIFNNILIIIIIINNNNNFKITKNHVISKWIHYDTIT